MKDKEKELKIQTSIRPFESVITNSGYTIYPNNFDDVDSSMQDLSKISCDPVGMAWSPDNSTLYLADAHTGNVTACSYLWQEMDVTGCSTLLHLPGMEGMGEQARPG